MTSLNQAEAVRRDKNNSGNKLPLIGFDCDSSDAQHFSGFPTWPSLTLDVSPMGKELTTATVRSMSNLIAHTSCTLRSLDLRIRTNNSHADTWQILDITLFWWILAARKRGTELELAVHNLEDRDADTYADQFVLFPLVASCSLVMPQVLFKRRWHPSATPEVNSL